MCTAPFGSKFARKTLLCSCSALFCTWHDTLLFSGLQFTGWKTWLRAQVYFDPVTKEVLAFDPQEEDPGRIYHRVLDA